MIGHINHHKNQITVAGILIVIGFVLGTLGNENLQNIALIIATIISSVPIFIKAIQAIRMKAFSIDLLVSIAVLELYIGEYTESSVVTFLPLYSEII